jgi:hypothetical protein
MEESIAKQDLPSASDVQSTGFVLPVKFKLAKQVSRNKKPDNSSQYFSVLAF